MSQTTRLLAALQSAELSGSVPSTTKSATLNQIRNLLPATQKIEIGNADFEANNIWLETSLRNYENLPQTSPAAARADVLQAALERVGAIEDRLKELEAAQASTKGNNEDKQKLDEILRRPEFQKPPEQKEKSVLDRWLDAFAEWLSSFFRSRPPVQPNETERVDLSALGTVLNYLVIGLAIAIIGFVVWRFLLPLVGNTRNRKKPKKKEARIILGEQIAPDATADDLLTQADRLAQSGEHRAAIRQGYIAALCDLSDRKVLGLARHKTNRDYLRDIKTRQEIYQLMTNMTGIFERHWYGDVPAEPEDWQNFRGQLITVSQQKN